MTEVQLEGINELLNNLEKLGDKGKRVENKALRGAGNVVEEAIKSETPVRSGNLKRSIKTSNVKTKDGVKQVEVGPDKKGWYGKFLEFGTTNIKADPFMSRGYDSSKSSAIDKIRAELKKGLGL